MNTNKLLRFQKNKKIVTFDFETCNLNLAVNNYPWQVSWVVSDDQNIIEEHDYLLDWGKERLQVSPDAAKVTGFDYNKVKKYGKNPLEIYKLFNSYFRNEKYILNGYNVLGFDIYIEKQWAKYLDQHHDFSYLNRIYDSYAIAKSKKLNRKLDTSDMLKSQFRILSIKAKLKCKLFMVAQEYGLNVDESKLHDALYDVTLNNQIFRKQILDTEI